ncbi:formate dehydrogenase accessory sulfurtransferase FdhD [Limnobacter litoralis]|uniref:Sulfur carrier protein FdhD n=1 Tax=Limnobacter litoralis TaxID=481366 RepID=A0ABQ5YVU3_9BURK|nr:formate dehydrogenase accessory sulfurtransferase FdhD [Limnobacter litoralis]GLR27043.1 sulfurtransferase FdhD [Limnobacter litoralis]
MIARGEEVMPEGVASLAVFRHSQSGSRLENDHVAEEVPVAMVFNGISHVVMMASPCNLDDFALGFALSEGLIDKPSAFYGVDVLRSAKGIELRIEVSAACEYAIKARKRNLAGRTGCGLCGTESLDQINRDHPPVQALAIPAEAIDKAEQHLRKHQVLGQATGATHAAAWVTLSGDIVCIREDVGRHNALDKLIGAMARHRAVRPDGFCMVTSRASFEMVQKAVALQAPALVAISAPTALAIETAWAANLTLLGLARNGTWVAYAHGERVQNRQIQTIEDN